MRTRSILFVGMQDSPHACRWINYLCGRGWGLHLFPYSGVDTHPMLKGVTLHRPFFRISRHQLPGLLRTRLSRWGSYVKSAESSDHPEHLEHEPVLRVVIPRELEARLERIQLRTGESDARAPLIYGAWALTRLIRRLRPDLIHSMELQHCGYLALQAREMIGTDFPPWLATNWGSDIYLFSRDAAHRVQIRRLLSHIDFYSCECQRDLRLARELGMTAKSLPIIPNSGGFDLKWVQARRSEISTSRRTLIMVKGYQHFAGLALTALAALERCADLVQAFEVVIFSASPETRTRAAELKSRTPFRRLRVLPWTSHQQMLELYANARVYLGVSRSDGISTSVLEAMAMGTFPIQTDTSCSDEWFEHGRGGYLIPPDDLDVISDRLRSALMDDELVDRAAAINWEVVATRLGDAHLQRQIWGLYDEVFATMGLGRGSSCP
jgi:glycosyltransferase involved in cell wall biosynthesis